MPAAPEHGQQDGGQHQVLEQDQSHAVERHREQPAQYGVGTPQPGSGRHPEQRPGGDRGAERPGAPQRAPGGLVLAAIGEGDADIVALDGFVAQR